VAALFLFLVLSYSNDRGFVDEVEGFVNI